MKKIVIALIAMLFVSVALNTEIARAQVRGTAAENVSLQYKKGNLYQNGIKLAPEQVLNIVGQETYTNMYKPARAMKISGISLVSVGGGIFCLGGGLFIGALTSKSAADVFVAMPSIYIMGTGAVVAAVGGVLWGVGNKKMKKIVPASSGAGLALVF